MTVLLSRNRQPLPTVAAGVPHTNLAAELVTLPSELLAVVCEATVELKVRLGAAGVRAHCVQGTGNWRARTHAIQQPSTVEYPSASPRSTQCRTASISALMAVSPLVGYPGLAQLQRLDQMPGECGADTDSRC